MSGLAAIAGGLGLLDTTPLLESLQFFHRNRFSGPENALNIFKCAGNLLRLRWVGAERLRKAAGSDRIRCLKCHAIPSIRCDKPELETTSLVCTAYDPLQSN
jgi:hypothetical protein